MHQISVEQNPYEDIYRRAKILTSEIKKEEAEELVRHLGLIYNTFGIVIKDFIKIVARKFDEKC